MYAQQNETRTEFLRVDEENQAKERIKERERKRENKRE